MNYKIRAIILNLIVFFIVLNFPCQAQNQNELDSLFRILKSENKDTTKIKLFLEIGEVYFYNYPDSALIFFNKGQKLASKNSEKNLRFKTLEAMALRYLGLTHYNMGNYDSSLTYYNQTLNILEKSIIQAKKEKSDDIVWKQNRSISLCYNDIGNVYRELGTYDKSIEFYLKSLKICENMHEEAKKIKDNDKIQEQKKSISKCYTSIGNIHYFQDSYDKAIEYYLKSLKIFEELLKLSEETKNSNKAKEYRQGVAASYNNLGMAISDKGGKNRNNPALRDSLYKISINYYLKSLQLIEEMSDKKGLSKCFNNLGSSYKELGSVTKEKKLFNKALDYYLKSLKLKEELGDKNGIATIWCNLSELNATMADSLPLNQNEKYNHYKDALSYGLKSYELSKSINARYLTSEVAKSLLKAYIALGKTKEALEFSEIVDAYNDSLFNEEKTKSLSEMETKYQTEKKQLAIEKLEKQKALDKETIARKDAESKKQKIIIYAVIIGFIVILIFTIILFRLFIDKKRAHLIILDKNNELEQANEEISSQRDEIEAQRDLVTKQKNHIEDIHEEVTSSIRYAKRIQGAVLPAKEQLDEMLTENFVVFMPRNIVSGDFYWVTKIKKWLIVSVADCTGHGVPGAFMSMLGISYLNEVVRKEEVTNAADVLNHLRENVILSLKQKGLNIKNNSRQLGVIDGMDITICVIDTETLKMQFAGANNSVYVVKHCHIEETLHQNEIVNLQLGELHLYELKGDKMPIAIYPKMDNFSNKEFQLTKGDLIYLFSDGYSDQFGGPTRRKFMYKQFKELLLINSTKPLSEQKEVLIDTIHEWIGENEQIDDITILGLKI